MMNGDGQTKVDLNQQIAVTLPLGVWEQILGIVGKQPWLDVDPIMQGIRRQCQLAVVNRDASAAPPE